jgi:ribosomal protein S18 acetylase RimI-like enzyme
MFTMIPSPEVNRVRAATVLARALAHDPISLYAFAGAAPAWETLVPLFLSYLHAGDFLLDTVPDGATIHGVALWVPPAPDVRDHSVGPESPYVTEALREWPQEARDRFGATFAQLDAIHARLLPQPHWHLATLGVDPAHQRQGYGRALLQSRTAVIDAEGYPCYLDTATAGGVRLYERHGFRVVETGVVPGTTMPYWAMRRD